MEPAREVKPSFTALFVALARAVFARAPDAYVGTRDPHAEALIPPPMAGVARAMSVAWRLGWPGAALLRHGTFGIFEHIALRASAIDAAIAEGVDDGSRRLVILGAGLDSRAYRLPALRSIEVVEVDQAGTQAYKRRMAGGLVTLARAHRFVSADLATQRLPALLPSSKEAGRTIWLMEGVTMYLTRPVLRASVADVAALSSPGDRFVLSYAPRGADAKHASGAIMSRTVRRFNEPFVGLIDAAELHAILEEHGFAILADEGSAHWSRRFTPAVAATPPRPTERIVTARTVEENSCLTTSNSE